MKKRVICFALICGAFCTQIQRVWSQSDDCHRYTPAPCGEALLPCADNLCLFNLIGYQDPLFPGWVPYLWMPMTEYACPDNTLGAYDISPVRFVSACSAISGGTGYPGKDAASTRFTCHRTRPCSLSCTPTTVPDPANDIQYIKKYEASWQGEFPKVLAYKSFSNDGVQTGTHTYIDYFNCTGSQRECP